MARGGLIFLDRPYLGEQIELVRYAEQRVVRIGLGRRDPAGT